MSLNEYEIKAHCERIAKAPRAKNKIIILCEGKIQESNERPSPQTYSKMETLPDASFYKKCVPTFWRNRLPEFFICGDREDVLNSFFTLLEMHDQPERPDSYLDSNKLFAIVDLDIQKTKIRGRETCLDYAFENTEDVFYNLYDRLTVNELNSKHHRIWVTGLIHKEAYFLTPNLQTVFDNYPNIPHYNNTTIDLEKIYMDMINEICQGNNDLKENWQSVFKRIEYCVYLDFNGIMEFQDSWNTAYTHVVDALEKKRLILALLTLVKSKEYWRKVEPPSYWSSGDEKFREQLSFEIARFYSKEECNCENHLSFFFKTLYDIVYGQ